MNVYELVWELCLIRPTSTIYACMKPMVSFFIFADKRMDVYNILEKRTTLCCMSMDDIRHCILEENKRFRI